MPLPRRQIDYRFTSVVQVTEPESEPLTLTQVKDHLVIRETEYDRQLASLIDSARSAAEAYLDRSIITRDWLATMDRFPSAGAFFPNWDGIKTGHLGSELGLLEETRAIRLRKGQLTAVRSIVTYTDLDAATTYSDANYFVDKTTEPGRIVLREGSTWPIPTRVANGVEITYTAGWSDAAAVPDSIVHGLLVHIAAMWENRGRDVTESGSSRLLDVSVARAWYDPFRLARDWL